jgi:DNA-binding transcriptional MocR family regulator
MIYHFVMATGAFQKLSGNAVKLLLLMAKWYYGQNNGRISFSVRQAADEVGCSRNTAMRLFHELQEKGFLKCTEQGGFSRKTRHASTWQINILPWQGSKQRAQYARLPGARTETKLSQRLRPMRPNGRSH